MQLRRFTADSTPAALAAVRMALGEDALILANRRVGDKVEIIATGQLDDASTLAEVSVDDLAPEPVLEAGQPGTLQNDISVSEAALAGSQTTASASVAVKAESVANTSDANVESASRTASTGNSARLLSANASVQAAAIDIAVDHHGKKPQPVFSYPENGETGVSTGDSRKAVGVEAGNQNLPDSEDAASPGNSKDIEHEKTQLLDALKSQSEMINIHFKSLAVNLWGTNSPNHSVHLQRLISLGIGAELAVRLVERSDPAMAVENAMRHSLALLKTTLPIGTDKTFEEPGVTVASGPPGVGKTTVLVKIAAQHVKQHGSDSIVLICADTRRIGAFEELQAYGRILGVPTVHAHDTGELQSLLSAFTHKQLVLIDHTLPLDKDSIQLPPCLTELQTNYSVRHLFVLAAGTQSAMADALIARNCGINNMQCVLTHLDTAAKLGELFNPIIRHHLPIAYWTDASSVQQPLQKADASVLVATAVAMRRRIELSPDDKWLHRLIQPTQLMAPTLPNKQRKTRTQA